MITRSWTVVAVITLLSLSSGCSGMKNFLFGRGARCGLCTKLATPFQGPCFGNTMAAPLPAAPTCQAPAYVPQPYAAPQQPCATPNYQAPTCGCQTPSTYDHGGYASGECGCGVGSQSYDTGYYDHGGYETGIVADPYMGGQSYGSPSYGTPVYGGSSDGPISPGQIINGERVISADPPMQGGVSGGYVPRNSVPSNVLPSGPIQPDQFETRRKFDTDGNKILWEEPINGGA
ncbi:hypothetical protein Pla22_22780 [Rubripirellula amarantea]|uniref:Uncharacterized protein n=2 Tax=Rubripirellula amarantea TaxID=2527999 RepID=A0A5C5WVI6_9BACT|nr:hypothetical protein Pla22_22780 [Rubripirellula amarantea]